MLKHLTAGEMRKWLHDMGSSAYPDSLKVEGKSVRLWWLPDNVATPNPPEALPPMPRPPM